MMRRALFYTRVNQSLNHNYGVAKKCKDQVESLRNLGWEVDYYWLDNLGVFINEKKVFQFSKAFNFFSWLRYFFYFIFIHKVLRINFDFKKYDLFYLRYELSHPELLKTLKKAKGINPGLKIIIEIPTYPYGGEQYGFLRNLQYYLDQKYQGRLANHVDKIVTYSKHEKIFNIPAINITNGITVKFKKDDWVFEEKAGDKAINLIAIGTWNYWHGLDRLFLGIRIYYQTPKRKYKIKLQVIGRGEALQSYKERVRSLNIREHVEFLNPISPSQLNNYLRQSDIGIGTLAIFRKGVEIDSSLKHRTYCASGLPFVLSSSDLDFPPTLPWVKYFPADESPILISSIIQFYEKILKIKNLRIEILNYARNELSWEKRWEVVLNRLNSEK